MAEAFTNAQLGVMIKDLKDEMKDGFKGVHARQDVANGRTKKLELWRMFLTGAWAVLSIMLTVMIPVFVSYMSRYNENLEKMIDQKINLNNSKHFEE